MNLSARNHLKGTIRSIKKGDLMAEIAIDVAGQEVISLITASSADRLGLKIGDSVSAIIKSTEVMIGK